MHRWLWAMWWPVRCHGAGRDSLARLLQVPPERLPILDLPMERLGLVVARHVDGGRVRLFGPVTPSLKATRRTVGILSDDRFYREDEWRFDDPMLQIETVDRSAAGALPRQGTKLLTWYSEKLLGKTMRGAPAGPRHDLANLLPRYLRAVAELERGRTRINITNVATEMGWPRSTVNDYIKNGYLPPLPNSRGA
jgi:hypothetical protein